MLHIGCVSSLALIIGKKHVVNYRHKANGMKQEEGRIKSICKNHSYILVQ